MRLNDEVGITLLIALQINQSRVMAVIDTAAQMSMVSFKLLDELGISVDTTVHPRMKIKNAENDSFMNCFVLPEMQLVIDGKTFSHAFAAGPISDELILGLDFWLRNKGVINLPEQFVELDGCRVPTEMVKTSAGGWIHVSQVRVAENLVVRPHCKSFVKIQLSNNSAVDFVTAPFACRQLLGPACIVNFTDEETLLEVVNDSDTPVHLVEGEHLTTAVELGEVLEDPCVQIGSTQILPQHGNIAVDQFLADSAWDQQFVETNLATTTGRLPEHLRLLYADASENLSSHQRYALANLLVEYQDAFAKSDADLGKFDLTTHRIRTYDETPVQERLRRTPLKFVKEEEKALQQMIDHDIIKPSASEWASAPVLVRKKDGSVRYAIDYRKLNSKTIRDNYPLPLISECIDSLQGSLWFHALDLASGYWQVLLEPSDAAKTAFLTKYGLFEFSRMPFGLCNAPATFQRVMHLVLRGLVWKQVLVYLDDVVVLGSTFKESLQNLADTLERFRRHNLKLKPKKCQLFKMEVKFLGRKVTHNSIQVSDEHVESLRSWPSPSNIEELTKFLGFINYHREFIPYLSQKAEPLFALTKKGVEFVWDERCEEAMTQLKTDMSSPPALKLPNDSDPYILDTDASDTSIGGCLYQLSDGKEHPITFASQSLTPAQRKYCTTRKELLAIVAFTRQFRHYLLGRKFTVRTDHGSLAWLYRFKEPSGQLGRWLEELSQYDMVIQHRPGIHHTNADAMSRIPGVGNCDCYQAGKELNSLPCGGCNYCAKLHSQWRRFEDEIDYVVPLAVRQLVVQNNQTGADSENEELQLSGYSDNQLREMQLRDPSLLPIITWLETEDPSEGELLRQGIDTKALWRCRDQLKVLEGVLHYEWLDEKGVGNTKLVVPDNLRLEVMSLVHDGALGGHWGRDKTGTALRRRFFWPTMGKDIALFVATCHICNLNKNHLKNRAEMTSYQAGVPNERVHLDFLGPFHTSSRGNKYILSIVDQFTKWIEIYPLPEQSAQTTAKTFFEGWITRFGVPLQIHTDQGRNFTSQLFSDLCKLLESSKTRTTPYRPSSNGQVERYNQMILSYIRCNLKEDDTLWDEHLPVLGLSLRATVNRNTGFTPNLLQLGREVNLPIDILFGRKGEPPAYPSEYIRDLEEKMRDIFAATRKTLQAAQCRQKTDYDTRASLRQRRYEVGDLVYVLNSTTQVGHSPKLQPTMKGPFIVCGALSSCLFKVRERRRISVVHHDRMRICEDRCVPLWVGRMRQKLLEGQNCDLEEPPLEEETELLLEPLVEEVDNSPEDRVPTVGQDKPDQVTEEPVSTGTMNNYSSGNTEEIRTSRCGRQINLPARYRD